MGSETRVRLGVRVSHEHSSIHFLQEVVLAQDPPALMLSRCNRCADWKLSLALWQVLPGKVSRTFSA